MSHPPFMKFFVEAWDNDTCHLSFAEKGAYLSLLLTYWQTQKPLPSNDDQLARMIRAAPSEIAVVKKVLKEFFVLKDGVWHQKRIDQEIEQARTVIAQRKTSAKVGAARRTETVLEINGYTAEEIAAARAKAKKHPEPIRNMRAWLIKVMDNERRKDPEDLPTVTMSKADRERILKMRGEMGVLD